MGTRGSGPQAPTPHMGLNFPVVLPQLRPPVPLLLDALGAPERPKALGDFLEFPGISSPSCLLGQAKFIGGTSLKNKGDISELSLLETQSHECL